MGDYRVVCVFKTARTPRAGHEHITSVGIGDSDADPDRQLSVGEVYEAMAAGDRFFVRDALTGEVEWLRPEHCCGLYTLATSPRHAAAEGLAPCASVPTSSPAET